MKKSGKAEKAQLQN